ncbi:hypothetical protein M4R22_13215 [Acidovorax sp. GBBC 3334]|uniref:hypothetical protein n=1 Tax=unclassified Acidovorax TaxID=2684926 RepID=UPI0023034762|nr:MULTISPECIES: hypothetical protein [unclassified Acidovorax]MDA8455726.1 hypothetical protein [Acidovorax sp. GBBC 3334]MDA8523214.1 hypothetical protein [Acidovorax sp. NCPPB 4044]
MFSRVLPIQRLLHGGPQPAGCGSAAHVRPLTSAAPAATGHPARAQRAPAPQSGPAAGGMPTA